MSPVLVAKPWGGRRLAELGKELPADTWIGESWEVADLPPAAAPAIEDARARIAAGPFGGLTLRNMIEEFGDDLLGCVSPTLEGDFPLLVKLLDAREHLSIQVHPDRTYVKKNPGARFKTESWYVVDAAPDSHLYLGLREGVTRDDIEARIGTAAVVGMLRTVPAVPGDFHHLPAGLVHALGAGAMVAEIQTPSDTTFRLYDWEDRYERPARELHRAAALDAIRPTARSEFLARPDQPGSRMLLKDNFYWIQEHRGDGTRLPNDDRPEVRIWMVIGGHIEIAGETVSAGTTVVVPAAIVPGVPVVGAPGSVALEIGLV